MEDTTNKTKYVCLTCGRSLERATSICPCGGRATRRPRPEYEILEEENQKLKINWKYRKILPSLIILVFVSELLGYVLLSKNISLGFILMIIGPLLLVGYLIAGLYYNCCPYCGRFLYRTLLSEVYCPYCGKRIKPTEKTNEHIK